MQAFDFKTLVEVTLPPFFRKERVFNAGDSKNRIAVSYWDKLLSLASEYPDTRSLYIEFRHINAFDPDLAECARNDPDGFLKACKETIARIELPFDSMENVDVRITGLPDIYTTPISRLRKDHLGKLVSVVCTVSKATEIRPARKVAAFLCPRCGHVTLVPQPEETDILLEPFAGCEGENCGKKGPFKLLNTDGEFVDIQFLKIQEPIENLRGRQPEFLYVSCVDELTGACQPGEKVIITGILQGRTKVKKEGKSQLLDFVLLANSIVKSTKDFENIMITPEEEKKILELSKRSDITVVIANSIAPSIFGQEKIKEGVALQLFSGTREENGDGTFLRGDIHILLMGDPGIAKSQLLKFVASFAPRAVLVSGQSASGAGLTGAAVHDDFNGRWAIECGALSLVSGGEGFEGGVCCVDELDKMSDKDRSTIHGALEQQCVDVAKAGVFAHMPTQCALLAAANPKYGRYNEFEGIASQFNLGDALLSRMDLLYVIRDIPDQAFDGMLAHYILEGKGKNDPALIDLELLRKYIAYAKTHYFPVVSQEAINYIATFYVATRNTKGARDAPPITVRALQAARRLAIAHARTRLSNTVELKDAMAACNLLLSNLRDVGIDPGTGALDSSILEAGTSGSQRANIKKVREIIRELSDADIVHRSARLDMVIEMCQQAGIVDPAGLIKKMKSRGDLMSPTPGTLKGV